MPFSSFKTKPYPERLKQAKEAQERRRLKAQSAPKRSKLTSKASKRSKTPSMPSWVKSIPESQSHGSGTLQKRLWKLCSDFVRIRDFYKYGTAIDTGEKIEHWTLTDAGHWKSYSVCNGMFKFSPTNIHAQSKKGNAWGGQEIGHAFGENLKKRYGNDILEEINAENRDTPIKFTTQDLYDEVEWFLVAMGGLKEQPTYWKRAYKLLREDTKLLQ